MLTSFKTIWEKSTSVADYFSKFPYVFPVASTHHFKTITHLRELFATKGVLAIIMSGNGPPFNGEEFRQFARDFDFVHTTSSPHFHQSNGFIEAMVKKVKNAYKKMDRSPQCSGQSIAPTMWHTHHGRPPIPSRDSTWSSSSRNSPFKTIQKGQYASDQAKTSQTPRKTKRTLQQHPQSQSSTSPQNQGTSPVLPQQTRHRTHQVDDWHSDWNTRMWMILHDPGPQRQSTVGIELTWSPYVTMAPPFKTLQWKKGRNSPKTIPFKTMRPARPNPCPLRRKSAIWTPGTWCLMNQTHIKHPQHHLHHHSQGATHLDHHHVHHQHHFHPENHPWSPAQRTPHLKAGRDTSLNQLSSNPVTLTKDSHVDFQPS